MQTSLLGDVTGALLLGGKSTRMGRDKAHLEWRGETLSTRAANLLAGLFSETLLVGGDPESLAPGRRVSDPSGPGCALRGLVAALAAATSPRVLVVATDLPFLAEDLLLALTAWPESDIVVPVDAHGTHPLCAIYRREICLAVARANLESDRLSLRDLLADVDSDHVSLEDLGLADLGSVPLTNINSPDELALLEVG
jgi:molybdopterin-guanine dinucleotide biosynthesis protein A